MSEWPEPREREPKVVEVEQPSFFPEPVEAPVCYCCGAPAVGRMLLQAWGLEVDVCESCMRLRLEVQNVEGSRWNEAVVVCDVHGTIDPLDCTEQEFTTEYGGKVTQRKSRAGRGVYPVKFEILV